MRRGLSTWAVILCASLMSSRAPDAQAASVWDRLQVLLGTWESAGDTQRGQGEGSASFTRELNGQILVRRSFARYTSGPQAGTRHDDLLVIYREASDASPQAVYFDSEGHVIRYSVTAPTENSVVFLSTAPDPGPRYRLSYTRKGRSLDGTFEIAAPGADFEMYLSWTSTQH